MHVENLRSPYEKVGEIVYFGRMLDKIRLHQAGKLPADYQQNLGVGFDGRCVNFLKVNYDELVERLKQGGSDEEILEWCFQRGEKPTEEQIEIWNEFLRKRGWNDESSERLKQRLAAYGATHRTDIQTFFDLIDLDEERIK
jgi:gluconokinase